MRRRWAWIAAAALLLGPVPAFGQAGVTQLLTGPFTVPPAARDIGGYISIEDDFDLFGVYRGPIRSGFDYGLRAGYTDAAGGGVHLGGELRYEMHHGSQDFPLAAALVGGAQLTFADFGNVFAIPFGVSLGRDVGNDELPVLLYGAPHLRIMSVDPDRGQSDTRLELSVELGGQLQLSNRLYADGALTLASDDDDNVAFAIGLRWR